MCWAFRKAAAVRAWLVRNFLRASFLLSILAERGPPMSVALQPVTRMMLEHVREQIKKMKMTLDRVMDLLAVGNRSSSSNSPAAPHRSGVVECSIPSNHPSNQSARRRSPADCSKRVRSLLSLLCGDVPLHFHPQISPPRTHGNDSNGCGCHLLLPALRGATSEAGGLLLV